MKYITKSYGETYDLGFSFASELKAGSVIALDGDLGAGKTAFTGGVSSGLGVVEKVTSPTFTIVNEYRSGKIPVFHFDVYRLTSMDDLYDIGWDDYVAQNGVILMEWASIVKDELEYPYYEINITKRFDIGDDAREISIEYRGEKL